MALTNAQLSADIATLLANVSDWQAAYAAWLGGTPAGGPNEDGRYPLKNALGEVFLVLCPAALASTVEGPAAESAENAALADLHRAAAQAAATLAASHLEFSEASRDAAQDARDLSLTYRNQTEGLHANVVYYAGLVGANATTTTADRIIVQGLAANAANAASNAASSSASAANSAALAATFNPALFDLKTDPLNAARLTGMIDPARIPVLVGQVPIVSSGGIADLTSGQQTGIAAGTLVATTDGKRWVYQGSGSKTAEASYIEQGDVTPDFSIIANKPLNYQSNIAMVSGLQTALDSKLPSVSLTWSNVTGKPTTFTPSAHTHAIADTTGLQAALDAKLPSVSLTWSNVADKPTTFTPSTHSHAISDVTGLQSALDAKLASASLTWTNIAGKPTTFTPSSHGHAWSEITGKPNVIDHVSSGTLSYSRFFDGSGNVRAWVYGDPDGQGFLKTDGSGWLLRANNSGIVFGGFPMWHGGNVPEPVSYVRDGDNTMIFLQTTAGVSQGRLYATGDGSSIGLLDPAGNWRLRAGTDGLFFGAHTVWHSGNDGAGSTLDADMLDGYHADSFAWRNTPTSVPSLDTGVSTSMRWKNYGTGHVIFDASNSTAPDGTAVNNVNPQVPWTAQYPTLMGWNGNGTYGVRVDSARNADTAVLADVLRSQGNYVVNASTAATSLSEGITCSFVSGGDGFPDYGSLMTMRTYSGGGGSLQLYVPYSPTYGGAGLKYRTTDYTGAGVEPWTTWATLWDSDNFDPATKAAASHGHAWSEISGKPILVDGYNAYDGVYQISLGWDGLAGRVKVSISNGAGYLTLARAGADETFGNLSVTSVNNGQRVPVFTSSTGAPSGGVDGDIHITY